MKDRSHSRDQSQRRRPSRFGKGAPNAANGNRSKGRNKNFNNNNNRPVNGNRARTGQEEGPGVCVKCGHPAPDGKLCNFHRSLLNSIRNDFGKKTGRNQSPPTPGNYNY